MQSVVSSFTQSVQRDALRFAEADANGDNELTFDEFLDMQPEQVMLAHSEDEIRGWFHAADLDGNVRAHTRTNQAAGTHRSTLTADAQRVFDKRRALSAYAGNRLY